MDICKSFAGVAGLCTRCNSRFEGSEVLSSRLHVVIAIQRTVSFASTLLLSTRKWTSGLSTHSKERVLNRKTFSPLHSGTASQFFSSEKIGRLLSDFFTPEDRVIFAVLRSSLIWLATWAQARRRFQESPHLQWSIVHLMSHKYFKAREACCWSGLVHRFSIVAMSSGSSRTRCDRQNVQTSAEVLDVAWIRLRSDPQV